MLYFIKVHQSVITHARPRCLVFVERKRRWKACTAGDGLWALSPLVNVNKRQWGKKNRAAFSLGCLALELVPHPMGQGRLQPHPQTAAMVEFFLLFFFLVSGCGIGNAAFGSADCYWLSRMSISSIRWKSVRGRMDASLLLFQLPNDL